MKRSQLIALIDSLLVHVAPKCFNCHRPATVQGKQNVPGSEGYRYLYACDTHSNGVFEAKELPQATPVRAAQGIK